jgi:hypothetical protein
MSILAPRWTAFAVAALLACAAAPAWAAPATPAKEDKGDSPAEKVKKALDQTTEITLENSTLENAINQLAEQAKVNVVIDRWTIQNMVGIDPNGAVVNLKLKDAKIRTALHAALNPYNLSYAVIGDTVVVTTEDMAIHRQMKQRVSVDYENVQLGSVLKKLAKETGTSIVLDSRSVKDTEAAITLQLDEVPLETAVRLAAEMAGLKPVRVGNVLFVTTKANAKEIKAEQEQSAPQVNPNIQDQIQLLRQQLVNPPGLIPGQPAPAVPPAVVPMDVPPAPVPPPPVEKDRDKKGNDDPKPAPPPEKGDK